MVLRVVNDADEIEAEIAAIQAACPNGRVVFVSGNFNIIHPGHLRLLNFAAECGEFLVVGVNADGHRDILLPAQLRLEGVRSIGVVGHAFILRVPPEEFIARLAPAVVVKGKEHEVQHNPELAAVEAYGGTLLFSSGEVRFSSLDLLRQELRGASFPTFNKPDDYLQRHGIDRRDLATIIESFRRVNAVVVGDLIVDEYITCDPLGMSQEDPTIVVTPVNRARFIGGASCVAAHAHSMGAQVKFFTVVGDDDVAGFARDGLQRFGFPFQFLLDSSRPTTLKQRFRASNKTLLRVNHLRHHDISAELVDGLFAKIKTAIDDTNLLIFSDFNYGCLPQVLVDRLREHCIKRGIMMAADSQASSQFGDISRFRDMRLLTPTEHEARLAMHDSQSGLAALADTLRQKANAEQLLITLGAEGLLIYAPDPLTGAMATDRLPAFNMSPKDVTGAGDSLFTCAALALASGADIWRSAYLGSIAAACQVNRVGNHPISAKDLLSELAP